MAYELHIERPPSEDPEPIAFEEWLHAVEQVDGLRMAESPDVEAVNPETGAVIRIKGRRGIVELFTPEENAWQQVFLWRVEAASFRAPRAFPDPVWTAAAALAERLGAPIRGDEGELYDAATGKEARMGGQECPPSTGR